MRTRTASALSGHLQLDVERAYINGNGEWYDAIVDDGIEHLRFSFEPGPSPQDIDEEMQAFAHTYGEWPELLIVDSLYNVYAGGDEGFQALERTLEYLHQLARMTSTSIVVCHHVVGEYEDGLTPVPLSGLRGKVSKIPESVLTLHNSNMGGLWACVVKNRNGNHDPLGRIAAYLTVDMGRMSIK